MADGAQVLLEEIKHVGHDKSSGFVFQSIFIYSIEQKDKYSE